MKNTISILLFSLIIGAQLFAQKIQVEESGDALVTTIYDTDLDDVAKDWKSEMKKYDGKVDMSKKKVSATGVVLKNISSGTFNVNATLDKLKEGEVKLVVIFDPIATAGIQTPERAVYMSEARHIVRDFAYKRTYESVGDLVKAAQKAHEKLVKQQDGLVKDNEGLSSDIENYKKKISNAERDITMNKDKIEAKKKEVEEQQKLLDAVIVKQKNLD